MQSEIKAKWVEALRSGKYKQALQVLRDTDEGAYCCLGVLCDIIDSSRWDSDGYYLGTDSDEETEYEDMPPESILEVSGLRHDQAEKLASMNDNGIPFTGIAELIEKDL